MPISIKHKTTWQRIPICYPADLYKRLCTATGYLIEIGPGRGDFLFHLAQDNPTKLVFAVEIKPKRFSKLVARIDKRGLKNVCVIEGDARDVLVEYFPKKTSGAIYINFPDPWPKNRHEKNRLLNEQFIRSCSDVLVPNGELLIATDSAPYAEQLEAAMKNVPTFKKNDDPYNIYPTLFAEKWRREGRLIHCMRWIRI